MAKTSKRGPKPTTIKWSEFYKLASYQCTQKEIADFFAIDLSTLENICEREKGVKLSVLWDQKKGSGRSKLKKLQWELAERGSTGMAIFLGKQMLGQTDKATDVELLEVIQKTGLTKDQAIEILLSNATLVAKAQGKKSYDEFCATANYPPPLLKQIEMKDFGLTGEGVRLILGARGYGKTDYVVILGIAYLIYVNPMTETNLIMSKSKERNASMIAEIAQALKLNGVQLEKENSSCVRVAGLRGKDHSVSAVTIKTVSLRGRHPKRIIMDDPVTEDDTSDATRTVVKKKYNEALKLCGNVLVIGQPAHKFDLYAEIEQAGVRTLKVPFGEIPELDHDIEAQRLAGVDEASIQASYFLKILNEGATPFEAIKFLDAFPVKSSVAFIDPSHEGGDYTALTIMTSYFSGMAVAGFVYKKAWNHCLEEMVQRLKQFKCEKLCFETNALGDMPIDILRGLLPTMGVVGKHSVRNKHSRIMAAGAYAHALYISKESDKKYIDQVVKYEYKAEFDDAPDSLASCLEWIGLTRGVQQ